MNIRNKKNVAIIIPCLSLGGAERVAGLLSTHIADYCNLYLFLFDATQITYDYRGKIVDLDFSQINVKYRRFGKLLFKLSFPLRYMELRNRIKKKKKEFNIKCSISFLGTPNILNLLSRNADNIIVSVRNTRSLQVYSFMSRLENLLIKLLYNRADRVISISQGVKNDLIKYFGINENLVHTIYNFFNFDKIKKMSSVDLEKPYEEYFRNDDVIINVGRLVEAKNQRKLIHEYSIVKQTLPNAKLVIIGNGPLENSLKMYVHELKLEDDVVFIPFTDNPFKYISKAKVFVLNSKHEGFGNVLVEAMACGVPVISTDCLSGPKEIIAGKFDYNYSVSEYEIYDRGVLVPDNRSKRKSKNISDFISNHELSKAIIELLNNKRLRYDMILESEKYIASYSIECLCKQWLDEIYN